ncbi:hypothetical protein [Vibrio phage R01]|nr:hypothetical protein [Vibrio phage R01]
MNNTKVRETLIEHYGLLLEDDKANYYLQPRDADFLFEHGTTKAYLVKNPWSAGQTKLPNVDVCAMALTELCAAAGIVLNDTIQGAQFVGDGTNQFDFLRVPMRGVVMAITVIEAPSALGAIHVLGETAARCYALVSIFRDDSQINSQGQEFISQNMNMHTGMIHTCLFRLALDEAQDAFPVYVPKMVSQNGYATPQEAIDNQPEDVKNMVPVTDFKQ